MPNHRAIGASLLLVLLTGCSTPELPLTPPVETAPLAPVSTVTCAEFATGTAAERPEPGSPGWVQLVADARIPYVAGESDQDVVARYLDRVIQWATAGLDEIPADLDVIADCVDRIDIDAGTDGTITEEEIATERVTLDGILGTSWRNPIFAEALGLPDISSRTPTFQLLIMQDMAWRTLLTRYVNESSGLRGTLAPVDVRVDNLGGALDASWAMQQQVGSFTNEYHSSVRLALDPSGAYWVVVADD